MRLTASLIPVWICLISIIGCGGPAAMPTQSVKDSVTDDKPVASRVESISPESLKFFDLQTKLHQPFVDASTQAIVFVFIATDCPIANYYQPTLAKLSADYSDKGIRFYLIHADGSLAQEKAQAHVEDYEIHSPVILDKDLQLAKLVAAEVTPEAHLIDRSGKVLYRGRIDDLYADFGKRRHEPTTHDLRDAIECFVSGSEIKIPRTKAVGCYIPYPPSS